ncbi:hypothetical protein ACFVVA_09460 [Kitasatospora sp. NPDC058048]|uniref:hypothetical protein n=1 Tax=Kitasatospora sp. NPDC058048 TaxID=3346313 RepID=UPI0036D7F1E6
MLSRTAGTDAVGLRLCCCLDDGEVGLVALAIRYGHMRTVLDVRTSSRYGTRSRGGIHTVLDVETALAAPDTAARLRDRLAAGEHISGPPLSGL